MDAADVNNLFSSLIGRDAREYEKVLAVNINSQLVHYGRVEYPIICKAKSHAPEGWAVCYPKPLKQDDWRMVIGDPCEPRMEMK